VSSLCVRRKSLAVLGLKLKGEKAFRTTLLDQLHGECKEIVDDTLSGMMVSAYKKLGS